MKVVRSGTEFMAVFGVILIVIGAIGAIGIIASFDWESYKESKDYSYGLEDTLMIPDITSMWVKAGATLIGSLAAGLLFIAVDRIALTLKRIQLGLKDDNQNTIYDNAAKEDNGYGTL